MSRLERKQLKQINDINEGILSAIAKMILKGSLRNNKKWKQLKKVAKDDPELYSAMVSANQIDVMIDDLLRSLCDRNPDHPTCVRRRNK
jgi:hypothetical protein